jgi:hypothetical protein
MGGYNSCIDKFFEDEAMRDMFPGFEKIGDIYKCKNKFHFKYDGNNMIGCTVVHRWPWYYYIPIEYDSDHAYSFAIEPFGLKMLFREFDTSFKKGINDQLILIVHPI